MAAGEMERLQAGGMRIYLADVRPLYQEKNRKYLYERLPAERRQKADACRTAEAKAASLAAGFLADYGLGRCGLQARRIRYEEGGRPVVEGMEKRLYLSLSHSGAYAACALACAPVGVDIQKIRPVRAGVLWHFFESGEREAFCRAYGIKERASALQGEALHAFLRLWAAKESYMKLTGLGMGMGFAGIWLDEASGRIGDQEGRCPKARWQEYAAPEGYVLAACRET